MFVDPLEEGRGLRGVGGCECCRSSFLHFSFASLLSTLSLQIYVSL